MRTTVQFGILLVLIMGGFFAYRSYDRVECPVKEVTIVRGYNILDGSPQWEAEVVPSCTPGVLIRFIEPSDDEDWHDQASLARLESHLPAEGEMITVSRRRATLTAVNARLLMDHYGG
jgi:hypothetical protein